MESIKFFSTLEKMRIPVVKTININVRLYKSPCGAKVCGSISICLNDSITGDNGFIDTIDLCSSDNELIG
jgi:hypothetical protein